MPEKIIETKICSQCKTTFDITDVDLDFLAKLSPTIAGKIFPLPTPSACPDCRKIQRLVWRVETKLFKRKCDFSGKDIISTFPPNIPFVVYDEKVWNSDQWNAKNYGQDFDFSKTFFLQFSELIRKVPLPSKGTINCENSDYSNASTGLKDCYLTFASNYSENTHYSVASISSDYCIDCSGILKSQNCYECTATVNCYHVEHSYDVKNCRDSRFLLSCDGCQDCYGCFNLINAQYCIYNVSYPKKEYFEKLNELTSLSLKEKKSQFETFYNQTYTKGLLPNIGSENVLESENVVNSQNVSYSRHIFSSQNVRYSQRMQKPIVNLVMDYTGFGDNAEKIYFCQQVGKNATSVYFCHGCVNEISNLFYSMYCRGNVHNCFGCVGLRDAQYCILNTQYSKEEYEKLVPKIIEHMMSFPSPDGRGVRGEGGEWGEYFPAKFSHSGYNDSMCQVLNPLTKAEALEKGFTWSDYEAPFPKVEKRIPANNLPEDISKIPDDILNWAIECEITKKPFRIIREELEFYRKHNLPVPKRHPEQRYKDRLKWYVNY